MTSSFGGNIPSIKVESGALNGQSLHIKQEPDALGSSPGVQSEDDIYEDAGDLDFAKADQDIFLTRIPKFLWKYWSRLDDDEEIKIGRVRIEEQPGGIKRMSLLLEDEFKRHEYPKEYNLHITNADTPNTFIFNEKDLPGYRQYQPDKAPMHWLARKRQQANKVEKKKSQSQYRRAVPKHTSLIGRVHKEINCQPVENLEYERFTNQRALLALRPKQKTIQLDSAPSNNVLNPGTTGASGDFKNFINKAGPSRRKGQVLKTARIPQNELLDLIFQCFKEYQYWPFKVLKQRVQQPEAYLKDTLEQIAFQEKTGTHMLEWQLNPGYRQDTHRKNQFDAAKDEAAPEIEGIDDTDLDAIEMEDVKVE